MSAVDGLGDFPYSVAMGALWTLVSPNAGFAVNEPPRASPE